MKHIELVAIAIKLHLSEGSYLSLTGYVCSQQKIPLNENN